MIMFDVAFAIAGTVCAVGAAIKTWTWWKSLLWALSHGHDYARAAESAAGTLTPGSRQGLIRSFGGDAFWPGAKSVRLLRSSPSIYWRAFDLSFIKTPIFILEVAALALVAGVLHAIGPATRVVAVTLAAWVCIYSLLLVIEAIAWYVIAKDYALVWGDVKFARANQGRSSRALGDFKGLGAVTITVVLSCSVFITVTAQAYDGFEALNRSSGATLGLPTLTSSVYYVLATMSTVGDNRIAPLSTLARVSSGLLHLAVILTITFALSAIAARIQPSSG